jgi:hypothetical protein
MCHGVVSLATLAFVPGPRMVDAGAMMEGL